MRRNCCRSLALALTIAAWITAASATLAADWPMFRGADRSGVSRDVGLLKAWPAEGPPLAWKSAPAGRGYSSLAIAGKHVFTLGDGLAEGDDPDEYLLSFSRDDGSLVWKTKTGPPWKSGQAKWQSSRSTPTVDGNRVYALTAEGDLVACETESGKELWRKSLKQDFGGKKADGWGYSESVLIDGERLVVTPGGDKSTMVALHKETGEVLWTATREDDRGAGHASIVIAEIGGTRVYVQTTGSGALAVRASDGKLLWSYPIDKTTAVIPTPIARGDLVFFSAGYKRGGALLRQSPDDQGGIKIEEVYPLQTQLANKHGGVVLVGDHVFGDSDDAGIPFCADLMTGNVVWKQRGSGRGSASITAAEDNLYIHFADGTMVLAKAGPGEYSEISSFKIPGTGERPSWAHPVVCDGRLYLRENQAVLCYDIRAAAESAAAGK